MSRKTPSGPVRYAVLGLGYISQAAVLPAFAHAGNSRLTALVSGNAKKLRALGKRYGAELLCDYGEYDMLLESGAIDAVYIALPNTQHLDYTVRAARRGIHVLCEKPLAMNESECRTMIEACRRAGVKLMTAYRLHFEPANLAAIEAVAQRIGEPRLFTSSFTMAVEAGNIRLDAALGGGTLYDIGIYCINAARHLFRDEPLEVIARAVKGADSRFRETEESIAATLVFPGDRLASFTVSFGTADSARFEVLGTGGKVMLDPAYNIAGEKRLAIEAGKRKREDVFTQRDQFAPELVHFSDCVLEDREPTPGGEEGLKDVRVIRALYRSAKAGGRVVRLAAARPPRAYSRRQAISRPKVRKQPLVRAAPPRGA